MDVYNILVGLSQEDLKGYAALMLVQTGIMLLGVAFLTLVLYIIRAIALSKISSKLDFKNKYTAFIPFGHAYVEGLICDSLKSQTLDKSNNRTHYMMLNIIRALLNFGYLYYNTMYIVKTFIPIYETGILDKSAFQQDNNMTLTLVMAGISILTMLVSYFRAKSLAYSYICFEKKKGFSFIFLSFIIAEVTPFIYVGLSKLEPVNTSIEKFTPPTRQ